MGKVSWPQTILILGMMFLLTGGAVILAVQNKDVGVILTIAGIIAIPVLTAFGVAVYQKVEQVKEISNGTLTQALVIVDEHQKKSQIDNNAILTRVMELLEKNHDQLTQLALARKRAQADRELVSVP